MSYDFIVYARRERLPEPGRFAADLAAGSPPLVLQGTLPDATGQSGGFLPVRRGQAETGFEVSYGSITAEDAAEFENDLASGEPPTQTDLEHLVILKSCDSSITFRARDDEEIETARIAAHALATASRGFMCDPQTGAVISAEEREA